MKEKHFLVTFCTILRKWGRMEDVAKLSGGTSLVKGVELGLFCSQRKQLTFCDATTGFPAK